MVIKPNSPKNFIHMTTSTATPPCAVRCRLPATAAESRRRRKMTLRMQMSMEIKKQTHAWIERVSYRHAPIKKDSDNRHGKPCTCTSALASFVLAVGRCNHDCNHCMQPRTASEPLGCQTVDPMENAWPLKRTRPWSKREI